MGRWLTDASPLLPLLPSRNCSVVVQTAPWAGPWIPSLALRFRKTSAPRASALVPLFQGGTFDPRYNNRTHMDVEVPEWVTRASVVAVITGMHVAVVLCALERNTVVLR